MSEQWKPGTIPVSQEVVSRMRRHVEQAYASNIREIWPLMNDREMAEAIDYLAWYMKADPPGVVLFFEAMDAFARQEAKTEVERQ